MQKTRSVEATRDRPCRAAQPQWLFNLRKPLSDSFLTSLSQRAGNHIDNKQQQDDENRAPTEIPDDGGGALLFHGFIQFLAARSNPLITYHVSLSFYGGVGRGCGLGRGLGVTLGVGVGVCVGLGVGDTEGVGDTVGVGVGGAPPCAQYLPPVFKVLDDPSYPPQTIISLSVHTVV